MKVPNQPPLPPKPRCTSTNLPRDIRSRAKGNPGPNPATIMIFCATIIAELRTMHLGGNLSSYPVLKICLLYHQGGTQQKAPKFDLSLGPTVILHDPVLRCHC